LSPDLDPITGPAPATLTTALLAERLAAERALREQAVAYIDKALQLQAAEYERRLDDLNHAHAQAVEAQAKTVPREMFDQYVKETAAREQALMTAQSEKAAVQVETINARVDELVQWRSGIEGRLIGISAVIGVVVIVVNILIRVL
jgi:hypothetical protein